MSGYQLGEFETQCPRFAKEVSATLERLTRADKVGLLITGPTGSGKSHLARSFHQASRRQRGPFVLLDCAQVTSDLTLAAELFGYAPRSGFANTPPQGTAGAAKKADHGTLFIDEVGCLPLAQQQKLLALIQEGTFSPIGASDLTRVDVQLIAATNENLEQLVAAGRFREDLYWRMSDVVLRLPPLSERRADIPGFVAQFLAAARGRYKLDHLRGLDADAMRLVVEYDWSRAGNIRGLERTIHRSVLLAACGTELLSADELHLPPLLDVDKPATSLSDGARERAAKPRRTRSSLPAPDTDTIMEAIRRHGSGSEAARALGISRGVLVWHLRKLGMSINEVLRQPGDWRALKLLRNE